MTKKEQLPAPTGHHNLILEDRAKLPHRLWQWQAMKL